MKNGSIDVTQEKMPPGSSETRHLHRMAQQFFYVLSGEAAREIDGRLVSPGSAHRMQNTSKRNLEILVTSEPPTHGDREEAPLPQKAVRVIAFSL